MTSRFSARSKASQSKTDTGDSRLLHSRRQFLKLTGVAASGVVMGVSLGGCGDKPWPNQSSVTWQPNAFLQVLPTGQYRFFVPQAEMGQGVLTGLTTLVAEELNTPPESIDTQFAGVHSDYALAPMGIQITGGSASIRERYLPLRNAAASLRQLLLQAAALELAVPIQHLALEAQLVRVKSGHSLKAPVRELAVTNLVTTAQQLPLPEHVELKAQQDFHWIGKTVTPRLDGLAKVTGQAEFGLDVKVPNMKRAMVKRAPVIGGTLKGFQLNGADQLPGVQQVVSLAHGVGVVADYSFQVKAALARIDAEWELPELVKTSSSELRDTMITALDGGGNEAFSQGDVSSARLNADKQYSAIYEAPYLAHATMEPMNCVVSIQGNRAELWVPTQAPDIAAEIVSQYSGIARDQVTVHTTFLGGGFGRRAFHDFVAEATVIAKSAGVPIQLIWSREDDMQNDYYRPASVARMTASIGSNGEVTAWQVKQSGPNIIPTLLNEAMGAMMPSVTPEGVVKWVGKLGYSVFDHWVVDPTTVEGLFEHYDIPHQLVEHATVDPGLRTGFWRSVGHSINGFFSEGFMDELAYQAGQDPLEFRLQHLSSQPRLANVLTLAAQQAGWKQPRMRHGAEQIHSATALGLAAVKSFESYVAQVAEVSVDEGQIRVHRVLCVVDCGQVVNPDVVKSQMEGGILFALSAALNGEITLEKGRVQQTNFDDYPLLRFHQAPQIEVIIVDSDAPPTGVGEPGVPPLAPAVANAVFALTGQRIRRLPMRLDATHS